MAGMSLGDRVMCATLIAALVSIPGCTKAQQPRSAQLFFDGGIDAHATDRDAATDTPEVALPRVDAPLETGGPRDVTGTADGAPCGMSGQSCCPADPPCGNSLYCGTEGLCVARSTDCGRADLPCCVAPERLCGMRWVCFMGVCVVP